MPLITSLHFTPDGVSEPRHVLNYRHRPPDGGLLPLRGISYSYEVSPVALGTTLNHPLSKT